MHRDCIIDLLAVSDESTLDSDCFSFAGSLLTVWMLVLPSRPPAISAGINVISRSKLKAKCHKVNQFACFHIVIIFAQNSKSY